MQNLRRKRRQKKVANKICLNLFVDESSLAFGNQNLYKAHEISQVVPLFNKNQTYEKFICANKWILDFMPNSLEDLEFKIYDLRSYTHRHSGKRSASRISLDEKRSWTSQDDVWTYLLHPLEFLAKKIQLLIMQDKTSETVSDHVLAFHPLNYEEKILREYNKKISEYLT